MKKMWGCRIPVLGIGTVGIGAKHGGYEIPDYDNDTANIRALRKAIFTESTISFCILFIV
tara:strand:+ start:83 stop:262 length:180 start_codon:yes stop_codon:yes gene_type:complete